VIIADVKDVVRHVASLSQLETTLESRYDDSNCFWISHDDDQYPTLNILVKGDISYLNYIPKEFDAGYRSVGQRGRDSDDVVTFSISEYSGDDLDILREAIVPWSTALVVAKDFFQSKELPNSVAWFQL